MSNFCSVFKLSKESDYTMSTVVRYQNIMSVKNFENTKSFTRLPMSVHLYTSFNCLQANFSSLTVFLFLQIFIPFRSLLQQTFLHGAPTPGNELCAGYFLPPEVQDER